KIFNYIYRSVQGWPEPNQASRRIADIIFSCRFYPSLKNSGRKSNMWYWTKVLFLILLGAIGVWLLYEVVTFPHIWNLRTENPTTTSMIEYRISEAKANGTEPKKFMVWTPIEQISPNLQRAVLAGEDSRFFQHNGFDWDAIQKAWDDAVKEGEKEAKEEGDYDENDWIPPMPSFKRGASTISQQLA